ncbi:MAG: HDIG domain-containing protein [Actinobacteria bacterium]|nr:HDIG domain-containing protein [Actinomycetota bacterium]
MPTVDKHFKLSAERTGKEYRDIHEWIDLDPEHKAERHDITKIYEHGRAIEEMYGKEALEEYIGHIRDDIRAKFAHILRGLDETIEDALTSFGIKAAQRTGYKIQDSDLALLKEAGVSDDDIRHCSEVAKKALEIAERIAGKTGIRIDMELVGRGALFHDLGKSKTHALEHGAIGAGLGESFDLPKAITDIMEKHIRGGLTEEEARELGLPEKDYSLKTLEEKVVIYADRLVDIITDPDGIVTDELEAEARFEEILRGYPKYGKNDKTLSRYVGYHNELQRLM